MVEIVAEVMTEIHEPCRLANQCTTVLQSALSWNFSETIQLFQTSEAQLSTIQVLNDDSRLSVSLPQSWMRLVASPNFLGVVFHFLAMATAARDDPLTHRVEQCLVQLASVKFKSVSINSDDDVQLNAFVSQFTQLLAGHLERITEKSSYLSVCQIWRRLMANFGIRQLLKAPSVLSILDRLLQVANTALSQAIRDPCDDTWNMEIFDETLESWSLIGMLL